MEFSFDISRVLREPVTVWDKGTLLSSTKDNAQRLKEIIDRMGESSAKAQGLNVPVTSFNILLQCPEQKLFLFSEDKQVVGMIKIGTKRLFIRNELDVHREITPICVLDFYVHESKQRSGKGKQLFEAMLEREKLPPWKLGYDRPSVKFVNFLRKHYDLASFTPQANNFVVFKRYFDDMNYSTRSQQPNASVSMRPLTTHKRRNSYDSSMTKQNTTQPGPSYYTPQKPQSRPDNVAPLSLSQLPRNNPYSLKSTIPSQSLSTSAPQVLPRSNSRNASPIPASNDANGKHTNSDVDEMSNYNYDENGTERNGSQYDDVITPDDLSNRPHQNGRSQQPSSPHAPPPGQPLNAFTSTTSSSYGSRTTLARQSSGSNLQNTQPAFSKTKSYGNNSSVVSTGHFALGGSELSNNYNDTPPIRGRSPARQRTESPFAETANLQSTPTRPRSLSLERGHAPPKEMGTLGTFNQSFASPIKFEKDLADPPQRNVTYKDSALMPPRRDPHQPRSPVYRLSAASSINTREMDALEQSMRNALTNIDAHAQRVDLINDGGYRAISPEPRRPPSQGEHFQTPQARSIFSSVQPTGSPPARPASPMRTSTRNDDFSKSEYHKKFHSEHPSLMSSPPVAVRVHPNSRSRQTPFVT